MQECVCEHLSGCGRVGAYVCVRVCVWVCVREREIEQERVSRFMTRKEKVDFICSKTNFDVGAQKSFHYLVEVAAADASNSNNSNSYNNSIEINDVTFVSPSTF